jgi:hypothetical protein
MRKMFVQNVNEVQCLHFRSWGNVQSAATLKYAAVASAEVRDGLVALGTSGKLNPEIHFMDYTTCFIRREQLLPTILGIRDISQRLLDG